SSRRSRARSCAASRTSTSATGCRSSSSTPTSSAGTSTSPPCADARIRPVFDAQMELLSTVLAAIVSPADPSHPKTWADAREALIASGETAEDIRAVIEAEDIAAGRAIVEQWTSGKRHLPLHDREVLKRAMTAYRKRLKVTLLDAESSIGGGPMSSGRHSTIVGITPPERYPRAVWDELVRQGRLRAGGRGTYELPPEPAARRTSAT